MTATMTIIVHVKQKVCPVSVGSGSQPVGWLATVGVARYDDSNGRTLGVPRGIKLEDGSMVSMQKRCTQIVEPTCTVP